MQTSGDGIRVTLDGLVEAWDAGDAERYGSYFTVDASYVAFTGTLYSGRHDIADGHAALFTGLLKGTKLASRVEDVRLLGDAAAVAVARGDTYKGDRPGRITKVQTYALVREGDRWLVAAFQNTQRRPLMERLQFRMNPGSRPRGVTQGPDAGHVAGHVAEIGAITPTRAT